jgi:hypothetical protein
VAGKVDVIVEISTQDYYGMQISVDKSNIISP